MTKSSINTNDYNKVFPSGICRMGNTDVTYYRLNGDRLWFDKKDIEKVLTGKNQHNLLGQYKDPKNHSKIFDTNKKRVIEIISKAGVHNYLKKAWSVPDERKDVFYTSLEELLNPREKKVTEPIQMPIFNADIPVTVNPFVKIIQSNKGTEVYCAVDGKDSVEKKNAVVQLLLSVAHEILTGKVQMLPAKDVANK